MMGRETGSVDALGVLLWAMVGHLILFLLVFVMLAVESAGQLGLAAIAPLARKPVALLVLAVSTAVFHQTLRRRRRGVAGVVAVTGLLGVLFLQALEPWSPWWQLTPRQLVALWPMLLTLGIGVVMTPVWRRLAPERMRVRVPMMLALPSVIATSVLAAIPPMGITQTNRFGLVCFAPNRSVTIDFASFANKDGYPICTFTYNSLGYRDEEPPPCDPGMHRVLVVGDSFVWGDGIPSNEQTLAARLRQELENRDPGGFTVVSAAVPGIGVYGYSRFIERLQPAFGAATVVVGYLGQPDHDPVDAQRLADSLPNNRLAKRLWLNLGVAQDLHEASVVDCRRFWGGKRTLEWVANAARSIGERAAVESYRVLVFNYSMARTEMDFGGAEVITGPGALAYSGQRSELWYARDYHPKPPLNVLIAGLLADEILASGAQSPPAKGTL